MMLMGGMLGGYRHLVALLALVMMMAVPVAASGQAPERMRVIDTPHVSNCLALENTGLFGGFKNGCNYGVEYTYCVLDPAPGSWSSSFPCVPGQEPTGLDRVGPNQSSAAHARGGKMTYWFACRYSNKVGPGPEGIVARSVRFELGVGLRGRCALRVPGAVESAPARVTAPPRAPVQPTRPPAPPTYQPPAYSPPPSYQAPAYSPPVDAARAPLRPAVSLGAIFSADDYPPAALRAEASGRVGFAVSVSPDGSVTGCSIVQTSGSAELDNGTCQIALTRLRFFPSPGGGTFRSAVRWQIPVEPPPAPPQ